MLKYVHPTEHLPRPKKVEVSDMKRKVLSLALALGLSLSLIPSAAAIDAYDACEALDNHRISSRDEGDSPLVGKFFIDFNKDGVPEMVAVYCKYDGSWGWGSIVTYYLDSSGSVKPVTQYGDYEGTEWGIYCAGFNSSEVSIVGFKNGTYGLFDDSFARYGGGSNTTLRYDGKGKFVNTSSTGSVYCTFDSTDISVPGKYTFFPKPAAPVAPPLPTVPVTPPGSGLPVAKAQAIAQLADISYSGDRSAITMTKDQANAILSQIDNYIAAAPTVDHPVGQADVYAMLFDTGAGVPGLFLAKGYCTVSDGPFSSGNGGLGYDFGEAAIWSFQNGSLVPFVSTGDDYTIYPACVACAGGAPDGSHWETRYHAMGYGSVSNAPATVLASNDDGSGHSSYTVNGSKVTYDQYQQFDKVWQGSGARAAAAPGGGVEYIIAGMTPVAEVTAALKGFITALSDISYASSQMVDVDGKSVEFQMYALKNANGDLTNYVKIRDIASVLNGTPAQFEVGFYGVVNLVPGWTYTPNGSEMSTPFSGDRPYTKSTAQTNVGGDLLNLDAIVLTDAAGGGYTYYQLRDLGRALGFNVGWSADKGIFVETDKPYTDAD